MRVDYKGDEIPAYLDITFNDVNFLIKGAFGRTFAFSTNAITIEVIPYYSANPITLQQYMNELCLRGKLKRGTYLIDNT